MREMRIVHIQKLFFFPRNDDDFLHMAAVIVKNQGLPPE
jgi:hypothetical protein